MKKYILLLLILAAIGAAFTACDDGGDGDADVDGDVDTDGDIDGDVDVDGDVDGDADGDEDVEPLPPAQPSSHVQSAGGGRTISTTYNIQVRMGAPQPVGTTISENHRIQVGPVGAPR